MNNLFIKSLLVISSFASVSAFARTTITGVTITDSVYTPLTAHKGNSTIGGRVSFHGKDQVFVTLEITVAEVPNYTIKYSVPTDPQGNYFFSVFTDDSYNANITAWITGERSKVSRSLYK